MGTPPAARPAPRVDAPPLRPVPAAAPPIDSAATTVVVPAERILPFRTAAQVAAELPAATRWIAEGLAAAGSITELVGKAKAAGKTTLLHHLCAAVLDGRAFLGRPTTHTAVVYLTEERPATHREALRRAGLLHRPDLHLLYWHEVHAVPWPQLMAGVVPHCHAVGAGLLVVDTIAQWAGLRGDRENNSGDARAAVEPLQLAAATGLAVVSVRHERKGGGEVGASGRGSSAFEGAVDIVLALRRPEGHAGAGLRHLLALSRFDETPAELVVELTPHGYVPRDSAAVAVDAAIEAVGAVLPGDEAAAVPLDEVLARVPATIKRTSAQAALAALVELGGAARVGRGVKGDPYRYWRASTERGAA